MNTLNPTRLLRPMLCVASIIMAHGFATSAFADEDFELFAAAHFTAGFVETLRSTDNGEIDEHFEDFRDFDLEFSLYYRGFFVEVPGNSQETRDGQYARKALGYNFYNDQHWRLDAVYTNSASGGNFFFEGEDTSYVLNKESDNRFGLRATGYFGDLMTQMLVLPVSTNSDIQGLEISGSVRRDWQIKNLTLYASLGVRYRSEEIWDYYYGIDEDEAVRIADVLATIEEFPAQFDFPAYQVGSGVSVSTQLGFEYPLTEDWVVGGFFQAERVPDSVANSPFLFGDSTGMATGLTLSYVF